MALSVLESFAYYHLVTMRSSEDVCLFEGSVVIQELP